MASQVHNWLAVAASSSPVAALECSASVCAAALHSLVEAPQHTQHSRLTQHNTGWKNKEAKMKMVTMTYSSRPPLQAVCCQFSVQQLCLAA
jgi:hypothetical protein